MKKHTTIHALLQAAHDDVRAAQARIAAGDDRWEVLRTLRGVYLTLEQVETRLAYDRLKQLCYGRRRLSAEERAEVVTLMQTLLHLA
jgi:hypothetical protein